MSAGTGRRILGRAVLGLALVAMLAPSLLAGSPGIARAESYSVSKFDVSTRSAAEVTSRVSGNLAVWKDYRNNPGGMVNDTANADIFATELDDNGNDNKINEGSNNSKRPDISGDVVVWTQQGGSSGLNIEAFDMSGDDHFSIDDEDGDQDFPAISGDIVVYQDNKSGNWDIRAYDIGEDDHFSIATGAAQAQFPAVDGDFVVWQDNRDGGNRSDIFGYNLSTKSEFRITDSHDARQPAVAGDFVVFIQGGTDNPGLYVRNIKDLSAARQISTTNRLRCCPRISGNIVVWMDERDGAGKQDIWGHDLSTGTEFKVEDQGDDQTDPDIDGLNLVWTDERHNQDIRGGTLSVTGTATPTPTTGPTSPTLPTPTSGLPAPRDERFFPQTGFRIDNGTIWDYFNKRGKVNAFGFPVSRTFRFQGATTQFFQRHIVQLGPDGNARLINLLDPGLMDVTKINGSTFPARDPAVADAAPNPGSPNYDTAILQYVQNNAPDNFGGKPTNFFQKFNATVLCADAFPNQQCLQQFLPGFNLEMAGIPTSRPQPDPANGGFIYQRFQRIIMHYDDGCRCTQFILLADNFKNVITGRNLPGDLADQMAGSKFIRQYNNGRPLGLERPNELPDTDMTNAFEPQ